MRRINSSSAALAVALLSLFVALGGTALAVSQIGTKQIKNSAVTQAKLHRGAVSTGKLVNGAVTSAKVAPNTFLASGGTAANANALGGRPASQYVLGGGQVRSGDLSEAAGTSLQTLVVGGFGLVEGSCGASGQPTTQFVDSVGGVNLTVSILGSDGSVTIFRQPFPSPGVFQYKEPVSAPTSTIEWQAYYDAGGVHHVMTAWTTTAGGGGGCQFSGQALTTG